MLTDYEKLELAFDDLYAAGIAACCDIACCQSCGWDEITTEYPYARGYVFWHGQDSETAFNSQRQLIDTLHLAHAGGPAVVEEIQTALAAHGFIARWDGSETTRIEVVPPPAHLA